MWPWFGMSRCKTFSTEKMSIASEIRPCVIEQNAIEPGILKKKENKIAEIRTLLSSGTMVNLYFVLI